MSTALSVLHLEVWAGGGDGGGMERPEHRKVSCCRLTPPPSSHPLLGKHFRSNPTVRIVMPGHLLLLGVTLCLLVCVCVCVCVCVTPIIFVQLLKKIFLCVPRLRLMDSLILRMKSAVFPRTAADAHSFFWKLHFLWPGLTSAC